ncbi:general secretion pathway protein GspB [Parahaliea mediterranea]|uniref:general secretion pathway protein GspB n=1 Tax=Parahaliea mediterranea TaxID=651086 RepID=UPI000E2E8546|nr:general secretion pathway protein GspB [Parahaliea mediterranea]
MSLILDAINRSQRERANPGEVPGIATAHYAEATVAPSAWKVGALGLALVVALATSAWLLFRPDAAPQPASPAEPAPGAAALPGVPAPVTGESGAHAGQALKPVDSANKTARTTGEKSVGEQAGEGAGDKMRAETVAEPAAEPTVRQLPARPAPASPEVSALYQQPQAAAADEAPTRKPDSQPARQPARQGAETISTESDTAEEQPLDVEALVAKAQAELRNAELEEHSAPFLSTLSQQRKDAIPTLFYSHHDYRGEGGSTVTINSTTAGNGQSLGKGVKVVEVLSDSVVLSYDGQEFRLKALNSWVNL